MLTLSHRQRGASLRRKHVFGFKSEFWKFDHMTYYKFKTRTTKPDFPVIVIKFPKKLEVCQFFWHGSFFSEISIQCGQFCGDI